MYSLSQDTMKSLLLSPTLLLYSKALFAGKRTQAFSFGTTLIIETISEFVAVASSLRCLKYHSSL